MKQKSFLFFVLLLAFALSGCGHAATPASDLSTADSSDAMAAQAEQLILSGDYVSALTTIEQIIEQDPGNDNAYTMKAEIYLMAISQSCADLDQMIAEDMEKVADPDAYLSSIQALFDEYNLSLSFPETAYSGPVNREGNMAANLIAIVWPNQGDDRNYSSGGFAFQGEYLYYANYSDNNALYRIKKDGSDVQKITSDSVACINVIGEWVYYIADNDNRTIYKIKIDGNQRDQLTLDSASYLYVRDDSIYFTNQNDNNNLYGINTDGGDAMAFGEPALVVLLHDNGIICSTFDERNLINIDKESGNVSYILKDEWFFNPQLYDDWIYYIGEGNGNPLSIKKIKIDGSEREDVFIYEAKINGYVIVDNNLIMHVRDTSSTEYFARINLDDGQEEGRIYDCPGEGLCADDEGNTYFVSTEGLYRLDWDTQSYERVD